MTILRHWAIVWLALLVGGAMLGASALAAEESQSEALTRQTTVLDPFSLSSIEIDVTPPAGQDAQVVPGLANLGARSLIRIPPRLPERSAFKPDVG